METLIIAAEAASCITGIAAALALIIKPIRKRVFGLEAIEEGQRCLLRHNILRTYYANKDTQKIRQYELENFLKECAAYEALKGNSFVAIIAKEVKSWEVIT